MTVERRWLTITVGEDGEVMFEASLGAEVVVGGEAEQEIFPQPAFGPEKQEVASTGGFVMFWTF